MSEGARVQARTRCRMPHLNPRGLPKPAVYCEGSPQRRYHKAAARCVPRFLMEALRRQGVPLTPVAVAQWVLSWLCCAAGTIY